ncbi:hypothetical protein COCSUDRAFT_52999 [Coccomyxa subellipsoidea C-169]|uniref:Uncharacterized protein n=1 Tax=Coccomyxa subellipsoidea (strain C-169) TaxID=574566 RepID=I0Z1P8_COCSC|nr:hypothetical protein COCSUDRAFT_52999 [Coccomyxa subellipsoidea C-169]EIE24567.1 hypothetical protein COCSUDRAFT_52999 [Coccomyxa subellipsoidea C-169]|eukprot:XP_005649111.1 hypothetical protein COCSUDRAFT_52999 [Coccomyxa subellipsoidea C-169]
MKSRKIFCLILALALVASSTVQAENSIEEGANYGVLPIINDLGGRLTQADSKDGDKAGPPPVKCTYSKGPLGINMVCT